MRNTSQKNLTIFLASAVVICIAAVLIFITNDNDNPAPEFVPPDKIERIVSLAPNLTEILFALELGDKVVGVTQYSDFPPQARDKPKVGTFWQPNIEAIVAAKPDLVVTLGFAQQQKLATRLASIGCRCLSVDIESVNQLYEAIEKIGAETDTPIRSSELIESIATQLDQTMTVDASQKKPSVLWVVQREPLRVAGTDTFADAIIAYAGGTNAMEATMHKYPPIGAEQLIACKPDVIIEPAMLKENLSKEQANALVYWTKYDIVPAVKNSRIHVIDGDMVSRLGPRLPQAVKKVARCLHPEDFESDQ